jgi:multiple sugar transport system substrate-binding protein
MDGQVTRREVLKAGLVGAAGLTVLPAVLAACSSSTATGTPGAGGAGIVKVGSNYSVPSDLAGITALNNAFTAANPGITVKLNTVDHNTFQDQINNYLGGTPDDVFSWFSGFRMRFFAAKGLATPIDDAWAKVSSNYTAGFATAVTGDDGHIYGVPVDYYPWCMFYRPSFFQAKGYTVPATWDDLMTLCNKMQSDGITPIAFADKDGWPAMGTFDILDLRMNGYDFHVGLLTGKNKWTDPKVTAVFQQWAKLVPFYTQGFAGLTWQQAADTLVTEKAGMYFLGLFVTSEISPTTSPNPSALADTDFFPFPFLGNAYDAEKALDAPIDIFMMSAKSPTLAADEANAKLYLEFWAKGSSQDIIYQNDNGLIPTANDANVSAETVLTQKAVKIVSQANKITQFLDRDSRPDFAGANGMQSFLLKFLNNPTQDTTALQASIQSFWDSLPPFSVAPVAATPS